jgi:hypothetical protein
VSEPVRNLELHEAMVLALLEEKLAHGKAELLTTELFRVVRDKGYYFKNKNTPFRLEQVRGRAKNYPALFGLEMRRRRQWTILRELPCS